MFSYNEFIQLNSSHFQNYTPTYAISSTPESKCLKKDELSLFGKGQLIGTLANSQGRWNWDSSNANYSCTNILISESSLILCSSICSPSIQTYSLHSVNFYFRCESFNLEDVWTSSAKKPYSSLNQHVLNYLQSIV